MNNFLVRTPVFPFKHLLDFYKSSDPEEEILQLFKTNSIFRESVYLYSKTLYSETWKLDNDRIRGEKERKTKVTHSLIKYFARMCYRSTPFGVSAGTHFGDFQEKQNLALNFNNRSLKISSDIISKVIIKLNAVPELREQLNFTTNNTLFKRGLKYHYMERGNNPNIFDFKAVKVDRNEIIDEIIDLCKSPKHYSALYHHLLVKKEFSKEEINEFLNELIDCEIVISDLQYNVLDPLYQYKLLEQLEILNGKLDISEIQDFLKIYKRALSNLKEVENTSLDDYKALKLIKEVDSLFNSWNINGPSIIQVDIIGSKEAELSQEIKNSLKKHFDIFFHLDTFLSKNDKLKTFTVSFKERYNNRSVALLEVLDPETGIGYPVQNFEREKSFLLERIDLQEKSFNLPSYSNWDIFLLDKYENFLRNDDNEIIISENDLEFIKGEKVNFPETILFSGNLLSEGNKPLFNVDSIRVGGANYTAGRFSYGSNKADTFSENLASFEIAQLPKDEIFAEVNHFSQPRLGNISLRNNYYKYHIPVWNPGLKEEGEIPLGDLFLKLIGDKVVLFSKNLQKRVIPRISCAQNTTILTNSIYNFLGELGNPEFLKTWEWGLLKTRNHLPRVVYKNYILTKERWVVTLNVVFKNKEKCRSALDIFIKDMKVRQFVTLTVGGDNHLFLDLKSKLCVDVLYIQLLKHKNLILEECLFSTTTPMEFHNSLGVLNHEIQIPLLTKLDHKPKALPSLFNDGDDFSFPINILPGFECLYFKVYTSKVSQDSLFVKKILLLVKGLEDQGLISNFFFIRYIDPNYHFRIRFFGENLNVNLIIHFFNNLFQSEINSVAISRIQIDTYQREIERYGGKQGILIAERIFYEDSICVLKALQLISDRSMEEEKWLIAMVGVKRILDDFGINNDDSIILLQEVREYYMGLVNNRKQFLKSTSEFYRTHRPEIEKFLQIRNFDEHFFPFFTNRSEQIRKLIEILEVKMIDINPKDFVHMFLNRFFTTNQNKQEIIIYDLLIIHLRSLKYKQKSKKVIINESHTELLD